MGDNTRNKVIKLPNRRLPAPADLPKAEQALWRAITETKPADWFGADSALLLREYVRVAVMCDALDARVKVALDGTDMKALKGWLGLRDREARRLALLGTKLRLTPQSKYTPKSAATAERRASGPRPWGPHDA
jgi:hypothetical protein